MRRKIIFYLCIVLMLIAIFGGRIAWVFYTFDTQQYVQQITADL